MLWFILIILIITNIFIFYLWFWLFDNIFKIKNKILFFFVALFFGMISGLTILFYPDILNYLKLSLVNFTNKNLDILTNSKTLFFFRSWLSLIILTAFLIYGKLKKIIFWKEFILFSIIFFILWLVSFKTLSWIENIYYIYVALWEEFTKFLLAVVLFTRFWLIRSDLILFSILMAIWFAFIENLVYLIWSISWNQLIISVFLWWLWILITRWVVGFLAHIMFTWNIGFLTYRWLEKKNILLVIIAILIWVLGHYLYDLLLTYGYKIVIIMLLILGYVWISYLFYKSDRLYANYYEENF